MTCIYTHKSNFNDALNKLKISQVSSLSKRDLYNCSDIQGQSHTGMCIAPGLDGWLIWTIFAFCLTQPQCMSFAVAQSFLLVLRPEYSGRTRSILWLLMRKLFAPSRHQHPQHWTYGVSWPLASMRNNFNNAHHLSIKYTFIFSQTNSECNELIEEKHMLINSNNK